MDALMRPVALLCDALKLHSQDYQNCMWVIACSGGRDSLSLAQAAADLGLQQVCLCSIDHGLQPMAKAQVKAVQAFADLHRFAFRTYQADASQIAAGAGTEDGARKERYRLLSLCAEEMNARFVLTAHHADDQAETLLMRLADGAGLKGLCGIPAVRREKNCSFLRPWLTLTREEIDRYAQERAVSFVEDPTNSSDAFRRNRLRPLLPVISKASHQNFVRQAALSAELCAEAWSCICYLSAPLFRKALRPAVRIKENERQVGYLIDRRWLENLPMPLGKWLIDQALERLQARGRGRKIDLSRIWAFWPQGEGRLRLPRNIEASRAGNALWIGRCFAVDAAIDF